MQGDNASEPWLNLLRDSGAEGYILLGEQDKYLVWKIRVDIRKYFLEPENGFWAPELGLGRIVALHYCVSNLYHIR